MVHKSCGSRKTHVRVHQTFRQIRPNERSHLKLLCYAAICRNLNFSFIVIIKHLSSCRGSFFTPLQSPGLVFFSDSFHGDPGIPFGSKPSEEYFRRFCLFSSSFELLTNFFLNRSRIGGTYCVFVWQTMIVLSGVCNAGYSAVRKY